jgi:hypothetical protein
VTKMESLRALLAQTAEAERALHAEEYDQFVGLLDARGEAMARLGAVGALGDDVAMAEAEAVAGLLQALQGADERLMALVAERLGATRSEIDQQQLATKTVSAYRQVNRRVIPQQAARFVDDQK